MRDKTEMGMRKEGVHVKVYFKICACEVCWEMDAEDGATSLEKSKPKEKGYGGKWLV